MPQIITVFGATGVIGSSVCKALAANHTVRAVTRDPNSPKAQALSRTNVTVLKGDFNDSASLDEALKGANAAFITTYTDHASATALADEVRQGKAIADACAKAGLQHVIYNTKLSPVKVLGMRCKHMDAKNEIEAYLKKLNLPLTCIIVPCLYEQLLIPPFRPTKEECDTYRLEIPIGLSTLDVMSVADMGCAVSQMFVNKDPCLNKTFSLSGDKVTIKEMAATLARHLAPKKFRDRQITVEQYRDLEFPAAPDLSIMFDFFVRVDQRASMDTTKGFYPGLQCFDAWVRENTNVLNEALDHAEEKPHKA